MCAFTKRLCGAGPAMKPTKVTKVTKVTKATPKPTDPERLPERMAVLQPEKTHIDTERFPDITDLLSRLNFSTADGCIWLDNQRMLLIHAKAMGFMRKEMIDVLGSDMARRFMTRMGYYAGVRDAELARRVRLKTTVREMFAVGPQLHCLEGVGLSEAVRMEIDVERGIHHCEFVWTNPVEDDENLRHFEVSSEPSCWMQIGYASGYSTEFMGLPVLYREVECQSMGQSRCRIVGKLVSDWDEEARQDLRFMASEPFIERFQRGADRAQGAILQALQTPVDADSPVGISPGFNAVLKLVKKVASTQATVLFLGESGVGKEVFAKYLHRLSARSHKPFIAVNCAAIPEQLVESELFGVERGAFTGAVQSRAGRFERANGGTLLLDEIGTLSMSAQSKLLRVLQEGEIERVGDTNTRPVDVRVIAATNVDLRAAVRAGDFREDLFFRLNVFPVRIPSLRERREDIPMLMTYFLDQFNRRHGRCLTGFTQRAVDAMMSYGWPGNVRELENIVERGVIMATDYKGIDASHLFSCGEQFSEPRYVIDKKGNLTPIDPSSFHADTTDDNDMDRVTRRIADLLHGEVDGNETDAVSLDEIETLLLKKGIDRAKGNVAAAARLLGITRPQMLYRLKSRGIVQDDE